MSSFKKSDTKVFSRPNKKTPELVYWKKFGDPVIIKEFGPIDYLNFSSVEPYYFAATSSAKVQVYNPVTKLVHKNLNKFKEGAFGGTLKHDGTLLCAGSEDSTVRLFNVSTRSLLRRFKGHTASVHRACFTSDNSRIASFSDDKCVKIWDVVTEQEICQFKEHKDYIRAGCVSPMSPNIILSGGYDSVVKMYDTRDNNVVCSLDHGAPVESALFLPSGSIFVTAGGKEIRIWDAFSRTLLTRCSQYHKTVTCMCISYGGKRLLTGSLDHRVKVIDMASFKSVHSMTYSSAILSIAMSPDDATLVTGTVNGLITVQRRVVKSSVKPAVSYRHVADMKRNVPDVIATSKTVKMARYEQALRKFQYSKALDLVMIYQIAYKTPAVVVTLFNELIRRDGLSQALAGRNSKQLATILRFVTKFISTDAYSRVLIEVSNKILDAYSDVIDNYSKEVKNLFKTLHLNLKREEEITRDLLQLQGALEMIFAVSSASNSSSVEVT